MQSCRKRHNAKKRGKLLVANSNTQGFIAIIAAAAQHYFTLPMTKITGDKIYNTTEQASKQLRPFCWYCCFCQCHPWNCLCWCHCCLLDAAGNGHCLLLRSLLFLLLLVLVPAPLLWLQSGLFHCHWWCAVCTVAVIVIYCGHCHAAGKLNCCCCFTVTGSKDENGGQ